MDPHTIALVSDWYPPRLGGVETHVYSLARALAARGCTVHVLTSAPTAQEREAPGRVIEHRLSLAMVPGTDVASPNLFRLAAVRALFERERIVLVHAHGLFSTLAIGAVMVGRALRLPTVFTCHSLVPGVWRRGAARLVLRGFARGVDVLSAVSLAAASDVAGLSGRRDVSVLPNGIDAALWRPDGRDGWVVRSRCDASAAAGIRLVSVMRLARIKRGDVLLETMREVSERVSGTTVSLTIAGDGPERHRLQQLSERLGLGRQVRWLGRVSRREIAELLAASTIYVSTCPAEAFGLAALEARCAGLPVVALRGGGIDEIVEHGRTGLLADSAPELADHIVTLIDQPALRGQITQQARDGVDRFGWDHVIDRHLAAYRRAIDCRGACAA